MTALAADNTPISQDEHVKLLTPDYPVAASTLIYQGSIVSLDASGNMIPGADTASTVCIGIAPKRYDNSAGAAGDIRGTAEFGHIVRLPCSTGDFAATSIGTTCTILDSATVAAAATTTNDIKAGYVIGYPAADTVDVRVCVATPK